MTAYEGEDVPLTISYEDSDGNAIDPDDQDTSGDPDADVTVVDTSDDTEVISAQSMTHGSTGEFEHVWDTAGAGTGTYRVEVTAEFSSETKIAKTEIQLE
ncbi:hypothetical protein [Natrinema sp. DC36]|uniref:hypothetical protein n=1 Tax=Natrinema sp. DC36 TaxID=2878680 RepID=UPI001CF06A9D|nr:hypothetical protein [Natrinema sp. DC36]